MSRRVHDAFHLHIAGWRGLARLMLLLIGLGVSAPAQAETDAFGSLRPADLTSPQHAVGDFIAATERALAVARRANAEQAASPSLRWSRSVAQGDAESREHLNRAAEAVDFSGVPTSLLRGTRIETVLKLYEALRRIPPAAWGPDSPQPQRAGGETWAPWRIKGTPLTLTRNALGEWRFSSRNVAEATEIHARAAATKPLWGAGGDAYREVAEIPGDLVAPGWYGLLAHAPEALKARVDNQALWQWLALATVLSSIILFPVAAVLVRAKLRPGNMFASLVLALAVPLALRAAAWISLSALDVLSIVGQPYMALRLGLTALLYTTWIWFLIVLFSWASEVLPLLRFKQGTVEASLTRTSIRILGAVAIIFVAGRGLTLLGVPLFGVLAGLSVGGLALALAAQPTIENLIAGMMLYLDQPVRVGDRCEFGAVAGVVEEIGIRSTRIRCIDGSQVTITNADLAKQQIRNASARRPAFSIKAELQPDTPAEAIRALNDEIKRVADTRPGVIAGTTIVRLSDFAGGAPVILAWGRIISDDIQEMERVREDIRYVMMEAITGAGLSLREDLRVA